MLNASAGDGTGASDDNGDAIIPDDEDANDGLAPPNPEPQQGQNYAAIAAAAQGNGLHPQVYLFANAPVPAPAPAPIAPQNTTITAPQLMQYPQPTPAPLAPHAPFPGFLTRDQLANETPTHRDLNPHRNAPPEPRNEGHFRRKVVAIHKYLVNAQPGLANAIMKNPGNYLFLPVINGGPHLFLGGTGDPSLFPWVLSFHKVPGARTPAAQQAACRSFRGIMGEKSSTPQTFVSPSTAHPPLTTLAHPTDAFSSSYAASTPAGTPS
ncbi:hypothetical protein B0H13DRAFT_2114041 [Mycena leptocephala]|nr:hypothetical protein B0H13DRAFT_2114041 [Mycena leptocephala]